MNYIVKLFETVQYILEPVQRQQNIILSMCSWLTPMQEIGNTFSQYLIPETMYLGNIVSSKGAFEWYLNDEFNIATYSSYQPIFIGTLPQSSTDLYCYNNIFEQEYVPLYFIQPSLQGLGPGQADIYSDFTEYVPNSICFVLPSATSQFFFQISGTSSVTGVPPFSGGVFLNQLTWQIANYGFNGQQAQTVSEDVDFIVWVPKYLNASWANPLQTPFDIRIRAYVEKYKMAHTSFTVNYY